MDDPYEDFDDDLIEELEGVEDYKTTILKEMIHQRQFGTLHKLMKLHEELDQLEALEEDLLDGVL